MAGSGEKKGNPAGAPEGTQALAGRPGTVTGQGELVGEADADFVGNPEGLLDTGANRGSVEIVAHEVQARISGAVFVDRSETGGVAEVVLRKSARPDADIREYRAFA